MGPAFGTKEYKDQVAIVKTQIATVSDLGEQAIQRVLCSFIMDTSFSRAAICQAEKEARFLLKAGG